MLFFQSPHKCPEYLGRGILQSDTEQLINYHVGDNQTSYGRFVFSPVYLNRKQVKKFFHRLLKINPGLSTLPMCVKNNHHAVYCRPLKGGSSYVYVGSNCLKKYRRKGQFCKKTNPSELVKALYTSYQEPSDDLIFEVECFYSQESMKLQQDLERLNEEFKQISTDNLAKCESIVKSMELLTLASKSGDVELVNVALSAIALIDSSIDLTARKLYPLFLACRSGHDQIVERLLTCSHIQVNAPCVKGATALYICCQNGQALCLERLLEFDGIDLVTANNDGITPLMVAASNGHDDVVSHLVIRLKHQRSNNIGWVNAMGKSALDYAIINANELCALTIIQALDKQQLLSLCSGDSSVLCLAIMKDEIVIVRGILMALGPDIATAAFNLPKYGYSPLFSAIYLSKPEMVAEFITGFGDDTSPYIPI